MPRAPHNARSGFTLVEIMVALAVGGIAIGSLYAVGSASTRHFREQQRISASQTSLRAAMDQLKHDFQRAGYMSTPNSLLAGEACFPPQNVDGQNGRLSALFWYAKAPDPVPTKLDPDALNVPAAPELPYYTVDDVWLSGNYSTSGEYPNISVDADGTTVRIPMSSQSFRRDFTDWSGAQIGNCNFTAFETAFAIGRMVRLHAQNGRMFYSRVKRIECQGSGQPNSTDQAVVYIEDIVPTICNMTGGWIAPVNVMHYSVVNATATEDASDGRMTVLRRTEMKPDRHTDPLVPVGAGGNGLPIDDRALLDYVVRFDVNFIMRAVNTVVMDYTTRTVAEVVANPERVRGVILEVAVRTPQADPEFTTAVPTAAFRVHQKGPGAARVRRARAELLLPNIANRGL